MSKPYGEPPRPPQPQPQPIQHVHVVVPPAPRPSQALPALVSLFIPGLGQLLQGRVIAWLVFGIAWGIGMVSICWFVGLFIVPLVSLMAVVDAALYDERNPSATVPAVAMLVSVGAAIGLPMLMMLGVLGLGAAAVSTAPSSSRSETPSSGDLTPAKEASESEPIVLDGASPPAASPESPSPTPTTPTAPTTSDQATSPVERPVPDATSKPVEPEPSPVKSEREFHTWTSGKYTTEAQFLSMTAGKVKLKKRDGAVIEIELDKLCEEDQQYIRSGAYKRGD